MVAKEIVSCFARIAPDKMDAVFDDAGAQDLLGLGQEGIDVVKGLKDKSVRGAATQSEPTLAQKDAYLSMIEDTEGHDAARAERLQKHKDAVCKLVP